MERVFNASSDSASRSALQFGDYVHLLRTHISWWAVPALVFAVLAGAYSLITPHQWRATQALVIRPEVASVSEERLGKFSDLSEMKTSQETILELAKSQVVIRATLREVGPPSGHAATAEWPTAYEVESLRDCVDMRPPGGAEFGKTEVFYLSVGDTNHERASALVVALCGQLEHRMQELRGQSAQGMITELERTVSMADGDLSSQTSKLSAFEARVGADLAELRNLNAEVGGQGEISQEVQAIEGERRGNEARQNESERLLKLLVAAKNDPQQLLATPNSLLVSQPSVSQLKTALVNAQLHTADLLGTLSDEHPFVVAARQSETVIRSQLNSEVAVAIRGLQVDIDLCVDREKSLTAKSNGTRGRMSRLAENRAEYANLVSSVQNHTRLVEAARKNLADARARQASANCAGLITRIDGVEAGVHPIGPARKTVTAAGGIGGLLLGFGFVFLFAGTGARASTTATDPSFVPAADTTEAGVVSEAGNRVATTDQLTAADCLPIVPPCGVRPRSANEAFGMFRGMSLQEAVKAVQQRCR